MLRLIIEAFGFGALNAITAVCVLPVYPGFLAYLANQVPEENRSRKTILKFGVIASVGVILFMFLLGLIFTKILDIALTKVIGIVSPIAFVLLAVISILLIFDVDLGRFLPKFHAPITKRPSLSAFVFGFFFGALVIPCNPLFIAAFFTEILGSMNFLINIFGFLAFGLGLAFPLLVLSAASSTWSGPVLGFLTNNKRWINLGAGILMLGLSLYELVYAFNLFGIF